MQQFLYQESESTQMKLSKIDKENYGKSLVVDS